MPSVRCIARSLMSIRYCSLHHGVIETVNTSSVASMSIASTRRVAMYASDSKRCESDVCEVFMRMHEKECDAGEGDAMHCEWHYARMRCVMRAMHHR
jgi:hypothetical protein